MMKQETAGNEKRSDEPMFVIEKGYAVAEGTKLYYETAGAGETVLLIHGAFMTSAIWDSTFAALSDRYRVVRYDWRGMGKSGMGDTPYRAYDDVRGLLDALEIDKAHVVGLSAGGYIAVELSLAYPQRVRSLSLVGAGLFGLPESERLQADNARFYGAASSGDIEGMLREWTQMWLYGPDQPKSRVKPSVIARFEQLSLESLSRSESFEMPLTLVPAPIGRLAEIVAPTLVAWGSLDYQDTKEAANMFSGTIPGARTAELNGSAHIPPMDDPQRFNEALGGFLDGLRA
ncbi:alpha/beta hydrolase [Paenibacillus hemerocallicola]|uniref:Alpha/beta hydrolase n=2 Tax=Paenibacillus hemerocallicola TaxID=1172614 RepID=A0A5C4SX67_9BACL|nr:alpha/beta hydrolase [Paenibacillus hemerocallicola]